MIDSCSIRKKCAAIMVSISMYIHAGTINKLRFTIKLIHSIIKFNINIITNKYMIRILNLVQITSMSVKFVNSQ